MFARALNATAAALVLVVGMACNRGPCTLSLTLPTFSAVGRGANVVPPPTAAADTLARIVATLVPSDADSAIVYSYAVLSAPNGTIDSVAIYTVATGVPLPATASVVLCATAAACTGRGIRAIIATGYPALLTALRGYGAQLVFFTTTRQKADGGAIRGVIYPVGVVDNQGC